MPYPPQIAIKENHKFTPTCLSQLRRSEREGRFLRHLFLEAGKGERIAIRCDPTYDVGLHPGLASTD